MLIAFSQVNHSPITMKNNNDKVHYYVFCVNLSKFYLITRLNSSHTLNLHSLLPQNSAMFEGTLLLGARKC